MSRIQDAATEAAAAEPVVKPLLLVALHFDSGTVRVHSGLGTFPWDGNTYTGVGTLGGITPIRESAELGDEGFSLVLSGLDSALVATALTEPMQGRRAEIWLAFLDEARQIIGTPVGPWAGLMDAPQGKIGRGAEIRIATRNRLAAWQRPKISRYTDADQQARYPGDRGFEFVSQMVDIELIWGPMPG